MILVDTSYVVYYAGFKTWRWFKRDIVSYGFNDDGSFDPMSDDEFKFQYRKNFFSIILNAVRNHRPFIDKSDLVFCIDCTRSKIWRRDFFPEYKILREKNKKKDREFDWAGIFNYTLNNIIAESCENFNSKCVKNNTAEGDDVIAVLTDYLYNAGRRDLLIVASDRDLVQLTDKAKIVTLQNELITLDTVMDKYGLNDFDWDLDLFLKHKAIMGDRGDEIPGIVKKCGPKTAFKFLTNENKFNEILKDEKVKEKYKINKIITDFKYIPKEISTDIIEKFEEQYNYEEDLVNL
jgi:5'-3' exonuclease